MGNKVQARRLTLTALALLLALVRLPAQDSSGQRDSLVRLVQASSIKIQEERGVSFRKSFDATFLHNNTYFICDTALWNTDTDIIDAYGHVQVIQDETILTSEKMLYFVEDSRAEFRGGVVELKDKSGNCLRTRHLDYFTKDSVAVFEGGGAMRSEDGQIIESRDGRYDTAVKRFTFDKDVNMFTDTVYVKTTHMEYEGDRNRAVFTDPIDFWYEDDMLSAEKGWYDRNSEVFFFNRNVHGTTEDQEVWSDTLYVMRQTGEVLLMGNAQVQDAGRKVAGSAGRIHYLDSTSTVTLSLDAAIMVIQDEKEGGQRDTLFAAGDTLVYRSVMKLEVNPEEIAFAESRRSGMEVDPVKEYRSRAAEEAARKEEEARKQAEENDPNAKAAAAAAAAAVSKDTQKEQPEAQEEQQEAPEAATPDGGNTGGDAGTPDDGVGTAEPADSTATLVYTPEDSVKIGFATGIGNVRIYRPDTQIRSERMYYNDLDSMARFSINPVVWNEGNRQYTADSLVVRTRDGRMDKANLLGNAFIAIEEAPGLYDQITGTEVMAYFDSTSALSRFDALGGSLAVFYLQENDTFASVNLVNCKMFSADLKDGELQTVYYFDAPKNDAYPIAQLPDNKKFLSGFAWQDSLKINSRWDVTAMAWKPSERAAYAAHPKTRFAQTAKYYPGYIERVDSLVAQREIRRAEEKEARRIAREKREHPELYPDDSLAIADTMAIADSLAVEVKDSTLAVIDSVAVTAVTRDSTLVSEADSVSVAAPADSSAVAVGADSTEVKLPPPPDKMKLRREEAARKKAQRDSLIAAREAAKEERWAKLDSLDSLKTAARTQKALERKREVTRKALTAKLRQEARDQAKLQKYIAKFEKKKARADARAARRAAKKAKKHGKKAQ